jgi:hypothetical protein
MIMGYHGDRFAQIMGTDFKSVPIIESTTKALDRESAE